MRIYSKSDIGLVRSSNQDAFNTGSVSDDIAWAVVCDGMGGANGGNIASEIAVNRITQQIEELLPKIEDKDVSNTLKTIVYKANIDIYEKASENHELNGMGTTVVLALIIKDKLHIVHAGDSRAYLISKEVIQQLTTDHSIVQEMVRTGEITPKEAETHPRKNIITRALGIEDEVELDYGSFNISEGEKVLICTDGLTNYINQDEIKHMISEFDGQDLIDKLVSTAKDRGGSDNITVVAISK